MGDVRLLSTGGVVFVTFILIQVALHLLDLLLRIVLWVVQVVGLSGVVLPVRSHAGAGSRQ